MPVDEQTLDELAESLYEAYQTGEPITKITAEHELSIEEAYDIQTRSINYRIDDGATTIGHKIGLTSKGIQDQMDVDEPDFGRILDTMFVEGGTIPTDELIAPRVEPEIGFLIDHQLEPPVTYLDVLNATRGVVPVLEIIDSRIYDWNIEIEDTIADNASSGLFVAGETVTAVAGIDLSLEGVKLYRNGVVESSGVGAAVLEHPARAVAWLANTLDDVDQRIEADNLVLSGSLTPAVEIEPGDDLTAEFTSIGSLTTRVSEN